jgi:hypothetical protein
MNKFFANGRGAYWIAIAAASLTFTAHAVQAARSTNETAKIPVESHASKSQSLSFHPLLTAAYRDGLYVGKLGAQRGEQRLAPVGRWAAQSDRDAFLTGYEQANPEIAEATSAN